MSTIPSAARDGWSGVVLRGRIAVTGQLGHIAVAVLVFGLFVWPVVAMASGALRSAAPGQPSTWSLDSFGEAAADPLTSQAIRDSLILATALMVLATGIAVFFAWLVARTNTPLKGLVTPMMVVMLATPQLFFGLSWTMLGNEQVGLLNQIFRWVTSTEATPVNVQSWYGVIGVLSLKVSAFAYLLMIGAFMALDRSLEEASRVSGASAVGTFFRVTIPALFPAIAGVAILVFTAGLEAFDIPLLLGLPAGINVLSTQIFGAVNKYLPPNYGVASTLSLLLVVVVLVLVGLRGRVMRGRSYAVVSGKGHHSEPVDLGVWRWLTCSLVVGYLLLAVVLPLTQVVLGSLQPIFGLYGTFTLDNYPAIMDDPMVIQALRNTAILTVIGGFAAMVLATLIAYYVRHSRSFLRHPVALATWLPWAMPGVVLGIALLWAYVSLPVLRELYATLWIVGIGLVVAAVPIASRTAEPALRQISKELEESSRVCGATGGSTLVRVVLPLIAPSFLAGWLVSGIIISGNLAVPIMLSSPTSTTVPVKSYELYTTGQVSQMAALFCVQLIGMVAVVLVFGVARWAWALRFRRAVAGRRVTQGSHHALPAINDAAVQEVTSTKGQARG